MSDSIGHSFLLLRPVLVCARVNQPNKEGKDSAENDSSRMKGNSHVQFVYFVGGEGARQGPPTDLARA